MEKGLFVEDTRDEALNAENRATFQGLKILEMGERHACQMNCHLVIHFTMQTISGMKKFRIWHDVGIGRERR